MNNKSTNLPLKYRKRLKNKEFEGGAIHPYHLCPSPKTEKEI